MRPMRRGGQAVGVDCGLARPRPMVQLNPSLDGGGGRSDRGHGHRPWIDLATGRTPPSMVSGKGCVGHREGHLDTSLIRRRQLSAVYGQLHHAALVSMGDVLAAFCVPRPRHVHRPRWSLGFLPETVGLMRSCIVLVRQWEWDTWGYVPRAFAPLLEANGRRMRDIEYLSLTVCPLL